MPWIYLAIAIAAETVGTTSMKLSEGFTRIGPSIACALAYALSFYMLAQVLKSIPVGVAYAIWSGLGVVLITGIGWVLFGQKLDLAAIIGIGLIIAGVVVMQVFSSSVGH